MEEDTLFGRRDWVELAREEKGHIFPTYYYWGAVQKSSTVLNTLMKPIAAIYFEEGFSWLTTKNALADMGRVILSMLKKNEDLINKIQEWNERKIPIMIQDSQWFEELNLSKQSGKIIYEKWKIWHEHFLDLMKYSVMGTILEFEEPLLSDEILNGLIHVVGEEKAGEYFSTFTLVNKETSAQKEEIELIELKKQNLTENELKNALQNHLIKWRWIAFNYDGPGWKLSDIERRYEELPTDQKDLVEKQNQIKSSPAKHKEQQDLLLSRLNLSEDLKRLIKALQVLGYWKYERKLQNTKSHCWFEKLMEEISRRFNVTLNEAKMITPHEMEDLLVRRKLDKGLLTERNTLAFAVYQGDEGYTCYSGKDAKRLKNDFEESIKVDMTLVELKGSTAYKGNARGTVRIVNKVQEMEGFKEGNILISASTSPDILPVMKKAAAIVTDSGGITCHAAIVARELKVPTLIGTKHASKLFKDGDEVEVDATIGTIRKL